MTITMTTTAEIMAKTLPRPTKSTPQNSSEISNMSTDAPRLLRLPEVKKRTGLATSTIYKRMALKQFPQPVKIGAASCWIEQEISAHIHRAADGRAA
jgi:predicted DNA-binding transcriptional regulator AlpA